jgi:hypothetical protein
MSGVPARWEARAGREGSGVRRACVASLGGRVGAGLARREGRRLPLVALGLACTVGLLWAAGEEGEVRLSAEHSGGNVRVLGAEGSRLVLAPELRDTEEGTWWFYWNLRLDGEAGQGATLVFPAPNPIGVLGPAASEDGGESWVWMGAEAAKKVAHGDGEAWSVEVVIPEGGELRLGFCIPYVGEDLERFLAGRRGGGQLEEEVLAKSPKGREVPLLRAGRLDGAEGIVLVTARTHACETMGSFVLEGMVDVAAGECGLGVRFRERWQLVAVPFLDRDGVEAGDQGKARAPHDHNRDFNEAPIYPEVAALMGKVGEFGVPVVAALDLHCPWIRGELNEKVYLVGLEGEEVARRQVGFMEVLARVAEGPLPVAVADVLPFGQSWNVAANYRKGKSCARWASETFPEARVVGTLEVPYARVKGEPMTVEGARALGRDLMEALLEVLEAGVR